VKDARKIDLKRNTDDVRALQPNNSSVKPKKQARRSPAGFLQQMASNVAGQTKKTGEKNSKNPGGGA